MKDSFTKQDTLAVKGVAILLLMFHHCFLSSSRYHGWKLVFTPFSESQIHYLAAFSKICVGIFVFLTAYGITISIKNKYHTLAVSSQEFKKYTVHRLINLYAGWLFVFLLCELFCMIYSGLPLETYGSNLQGVIYFLLDGLGVANLFGTPTLVATWWYMSLAVTLVFCMPLLIKIYQKTGFVMMAALFIILSRQLGLTDSSLIHWIPAALLGIVSADKNLLVKISNFELIKSKKTVNKILKLLIGIVLFGLLIKFRQSGISAVLFEIKDGVIPFFVVCFSYEFICAMKYLRGALVVIGKYSMDIFLIHTLIRATYFRKFIYGFRYVPLIVLVLLGISLVISILIEQLKKYTGYNQLVNKIQKYV